MSAENVEIARRTFEAYARGDAAAALDAIDPDVVYDLTELGAGGEVYRGHLGLQAGLRTWIGAWEGYAARLEQVIDAGDKAVVVFTERGRGKGSGLEIEHRIYDVWTLRQGRVVHIRSHLDRRRALADAGLRDEDAG